MTSRKIQIFDELLDFLVPITFWNEKIIVLNVTLNFLGTAYWFERKSHTSERNRFIKIIIIYSLSLYTYRIYRIYMYIYIYPISYIYIYIILHILYIIKTSPNTNGLSQRPATHPAISSVRVSVRCW